MLCFTIFKEHWMQHAEKCPWVHIYLSLHLIDFHIEITTKRAKNMTYSTPTENQCISKYSTISTICYTLPHLFKNVPSHSQYLFQNYHFRYYYVKNDTKKTKLLPANYMTQLMPQR